MKISVFGLGKIGLPLAVQYASKGHEVVGVDIKQETVDQVAKGQEPFPGEFDLASRLKQVVSNGKLSATTEGAVAVSTSEVVVVAVPLIVDEDGEPDFSVMDAAVREIGRGLTPRTLVIFETTLPVGTTRRRLTPLLEDQSGLNQSRDFSVAFSPERVLTGRVFQDLRRYPKLVGGVDESSGLLAKSFYESVLDFDERQDLPQGNGVWLMASAEAAELAKLAETTYRDVNIGLANEFALFAESNDIDIYEVIAACNSQPFSHIHSPGVAVGGHCIPVYPRLYLSNDPKAVIVTTARKVNAGMPLAAIRRLVDLFGPLDGLTIVVLGASYRGGVKETAFSGVFAICRELEHAGAAVQVHDPLFTKQEISSMGFVPYSKGQPAEGIVLQADHQEYLSWGPEDVPGTRFVFDGRNFTSPSGWPGVFHISLGKPPVGDLP